MAPDRTQYLLGTSDSEIEHLLSQAVACERPSGALLDRLPLQPDWRAVDLGCGVLGILHQLAERIGPSGAVVGLDREARMLEVAEGELARRSLPGVSLVQGDLTDNDLPPGSFDLAHARTLLCNVPGAASLVGTIASLVRPGGFVALEEPDSAGWVCEPGHPAWDRLLTVFRDTYRRRDCDTDIGRRLPALLRAAGLVDVGVDVRAMWVTRPGDWAHTQLPVFVRQMRDVVSGSGSDPDEVDDPDELNDPDEVDDLIDQVTRHLAGPDTLTYALLWQCWGRRPAG